MLLGLYTEQFLSIHWLSLSVVTGLSLSLVVAAQSSSSTLSIWDTDTCSVGRAVCTHGALLMWLLWLAVVLLLLWSLLLLLLRCSCSACCCVAAMLLLPGCCGCHTGHIQAHTYKQRTRIPHTKFLYSSSSVCSSVQIIWALAQYLQYTGLFSIYTLKIILFFPVASPNVFLSIQVGCSFSLIGYWRIWVWVH